MKHLLVAFALVGCGGEAFGAFGASEADAGAGDSTTPAVDAPFVEGDAGPSDDAGDEVDTPGAGGSDGGVELEAGNDDSSSGGASNTGGAPATGGAPMTGGSGGCEIVTHHNGLGQTWQDCVPLGTHNATQALKACEAFTAASCPSASCILPVGACSDGNNSAEYTGDCGDGRILWTFAPGYQSNGVGHVANTNCPTSQDPSWN